MIRILPGLGLCLMVMYDVWMLRSMQARQALQTHGTRKDGSHDNRAAALSGKNNPFITKKIK